MKEMASRNSKRKADATKLSRRKRALIYPLSAASIDSCSNLLSAVDDSVSCGSSGVERSSKLKKIRIEEEVVSADPKFRRITRSHSKLTNEFEVSETSFARSDVSFAENKESDVVSLISGVDSCSKFGSITGGGVADYNETEISKPSGHVALNPKLENHTIECVSDLACTETFSVDEDESSEIFSQYSDLDSSSDYTKLF